jgi:hypothetical protein
MTKEEVLKEIEAVTDLTNLDGKRILGGIRTWIEGIKDVAGDRRAEERDPFEGEQKEAIRRGLVKEKGIKAKAI